MKKILLTITLCFALSGIAAAVVNINTASKEELLTLKGVGEKRAQEIIDYRKKNGNFKSIDDLEKVPGIGPGLMKQIRSDITVTGKTSSTDKPKGEAEKSKSTTGKTAEAPKSAAMKSTTAATKPADKPNADEKKAEKK